MENTNYTQFREFDENLRMLPDIVTWTERTQLIYRKRIVEIG